ncbi:MAG: response regulator [Chloroflexi bacterium]|nr:response regulator [Chloroflexota bacterium]
MADEKIRIMIVDDVVESQKNLARLLSFENDMEVIGFASTGAEALEEARKIQPHVILMDINMPDMDGIRATEIITKSIPCSVVMISVQSDRDYMRRAMQAGAVDFIAKPPSAEELYATVRNAYQRRPTFTKEIKEKKEERAVKVSGKILVVYSPQGGAGVTTVAVNMAAAMMSDYHRAILVDANLQFGDVVVHLDRPNERNLVDLAQAADILDNELIQQVVIQHDSGLNILAAPKRPEEAELVAPANLGKVVQALAEQYDYVVVDTSLHLDDITLNLFEIADVVMFVGLPMIPAAKNLRVVLDLLNQLGFDSSKSMFVINRVPTDKRSGALNPEDVGNLLKLQVAAAIPSVEKAMYDALNRGVPVIISTKSSPSKELRDLAQVVMERLNQGRIELDEDDFVQPEGDRQKGGRRGGLF